MINTDARYTVYIDKAYRNYYNTYPDAEKTFQYEGSNIEVRRLTHQEFINECQTNDDFANRWGCKIVIKELSHQERSDLKNSPPYEYGKTANGKLIDKRLLDSCNVPTKLITVIYTEKIESYV
jgi:hypothetical protein